MRVSESLKVMALTMLGALVFFACPASHSWAQSAMGDTPPMAVRSSPSQELRRLDRLLKLSDDQKVKIFPILQRRTETIEKLIADQETSMLEKFPKIVTIRDRSNDEIRSLLNESQQKKFDRQVAEEKKRMESGPEDSSFPGDMPPPPPE